ncbi:copper amine oxidase N-terminal domain-containing protein [Paenibacillus hodogayensis]|uniref:Copper amine oxidase N-terminal domain-containing protein n=1 Tax=Paenibacillus hodogayensis TaxID=279208 RepID=A0ABV5VU53_9BACL
MKKFILGVICGAGIMAAPVLYASDAVVAKLWPVEVEVNGKPQQLSADEAIWNINGKAYAPVRWLAEQLGAGAMYRDRDGELSIRSEPAEGDPMSKAEWLVQYRLKLGMSEQEVRDLLGEPAAAVKNAQNIGSWRYDIGAKPGYRFGAKPGSADVDALQAGSIAAQGYIVWSGERRVEQVMLAYARQGNITFHYLFPDGSTGGGLYE